MRTKWWLQDKAGDDKVGAGGGAGAGGEGAAAGAAAAGAAAGASGAAGAGAGAGAAAGAAAAGGAGEGKGFAWGDGWRDALAAGDEKTLKRLERFGSPADIFKSYRAMEQRVSSGELKANVPFPDKGTDEEKGAWRKDAGIPDKPEAYDLKFDDGFVVGEDDKPMVDDFLKAAHANNLPPSAVKASVRWYFDSIEKRVEEQKAADETVRQKTEDELRSEWGNEYRKNVNIVKAFMESAPEPIREKLIFARLSDGTPLTSDANALRWLNSIARQANPVSTVVPAGDAATMASSIDDEIATIEKTMRTNRSTYNKDAKMQERYRELLTAREQLKKKA